MIMLLYLQFLVFILSLLTTQVKAGGDFLQPWRAGRTKDYSENLNYAVGTRITFQWFADFGSASIDLVQDNHPGDAQGGPSIRLEDSYDETTWNWKVSYAGLDPAFNNVFYLLVGPGDESGDSFTSHYFNISRESTTSSATAAASSSLRSSASPGSTTSQSPPPSPATVTVTPSSTQNDATPPGTIAGAVIGAVVGTVLLAGGAWWAWKSKKKRYSGNMVEAQQQQVSPTFHPGSYSEPKPYEVDGGSHIPELQQTEGGQMAELQETERRRWFELEAEGRGARF